MPRSKEAMTRSSGALPSKRTRQPLIVPGAGPVVVPPPVKQEPAKREEEDALGTQANISLGFKRLMTEAAKRTGRSAKFCTEEACMSWLSRNGPDVPVTPEEPDMRRDVDKMSVQTWISRGVKRMMLAATRGRTLKYCIDKACSEWLKVNGSTPS